MFSLWVSNKGGCGMQLIVKGRHMDVAPALRSYAEEKIGRVAKILNHMLMSGEVELYTEHNRSIDKREVAEVTKHAGEMEEHLDLIDRKTACLFSVCMRLGGILGGATPAQLDNLSRYEEVF